MVGHGKANVGMNCTVRILTHPFNRGSSYSQYGGNEAALVEDTGGWIVFKFPNLSSYDGYSLS